MKAETLHNHAMELAQEGFVIKLKGDISASQPYFLDALWYEKEAIELYENEGNAEPWRSVLLRSAASLALDCQQLNEAEKLAITEKLAIKGLDGNPPNEIEEELWDILLKVKSHSESFKAKIRSSVEFAT
jgi:hypothetical protein